MDKLNPKNEPIMFSALVVIVGWVVTRFALGMDANTVNAVCVLLFGAGSYFARTLSTPVAKRDKAVKEVIQAANAGQAVPPKAS